MTAQLSTAFPPALEEAPPGSDLLTAADRNLRILQGRPRISIRPQLEAILQTIAEADALAIRDSTRKRAEMLLDRVLDLQSEVAQAIATQRAALRKLGGRESLRRARAEGKSKGLSGGALAKHNNKRLGSSHLKGAVQ